MRREVNPDPVPPPKEWKIRKPWSPVHWSASFLMRSRTMSTISLPMQILSINLLLSSKKQERGNKSEHIPAYLGRPSDPCHVFDPLYLPPVTLFINQCPPPPLLSTLRRCLEPKEVACAVKEKIRYFQFTLLLMLLSYNKRYRFLTYKNGQFCTRF